MLFFCWLENRTYECTMSAKDCIGSSLHALLRFGPGVSSGSARRQCFCEGLPASFSSICTHDACERLYSFMVSCLIASWFWRDAHEQGESKVFLSDPGRTSSHMHARCLRKTVQFHGFMPYCFLVLA